MFSVVRHYQHISNHDDFVQHVVNEFLPDLRGIPGFKAFHLIDVGDEGGRMMSVVYFEDEASAEVGNQHSMEWVRANVGLFQAATLVEQGPVVVSS